MSNEILVIEQPKPEKAPRPLTEQERIRKHERIKKRELYELDKIVGRRDDSGRYQLQEIKTVHKRTVALHARGFSNIDIGKKLGRTAHTISRYLQDPLVQKYLSIEYHGAVQETRGLMFAAIDAVRAAMESNDIEIRLKGVDKFDKLTKLITPEGRELSKGSSVAVTITNGAPVEDQTSAVDRLIDKLGEIAERHPNFLAPEEEDQAPAVVEGEVTEVEVIEVEDDE